MYLYTDVQIQIKVKVLLVCPKSIQTLNKLEQQYTREKLPKFCSIDKLTHYQLCKKLALFYNQTALQGYISLFGH